MEGLCDNRGYRCSIDFATLILAACVTVTTKAVLGANTYLQASTWTAGGFENLEETCRKGSQWDARGVGIMMRASRKVSDAHIQ